MRFVLQLLLLFLTLDLLAQSKESICTPEAIYFQKFVENGINIDSENWLNDSLAFPPGNYYYLNKVTFSLNPGLVLGFLFGKGIIIKDAWYRPSDSRCGNSEVMVHSSLIIRTESNKKRHLLKKYGFVKTQEPFPGECPYHVLHYVFSN